MTAERRSCCMHSRLTSLDGSFLRLETPTAHMHVAWSGLFEAPTVAPRPTVAALRGKVAARLSRVPRFRQRLAFPPMRLAEPSWVDDHEFDIARHVTELGEGGRPLVGALPGPHRCGPLRTARPRSPAVARYLVRQLDDGRLGLVFKMHHALVDGKSAVELALLLFDTSPDAEPEPQEEWRPADPRTPRALHSTRSPAVPRSRCARPRHGANGRASRRGRPAGTLKRAAMAFEQDLLRAAPSSYLNAPIGLRGCSCAIAPGWRTSFEAKRRAGATVNDVCLAAVTGALRELALAAAGAAAAAEGDGAGQRARRRSAAGHRQPDLVRVHRAAGRGPLAPGRLERVHEATAAFKASGRPRGPAPCWERSGCCRTRSRTGPRGWPPARACST